MQSSLGMETSKGPQTRFSKHQFPWVTLNLQAAAVHMLKHMGTPWGAGGCQRAEQKLERVSPLWELTSQWSRASIAPDRESEDG